MYDHINTLSTVQATDCNLKHPFPHMQPVQRISSRKNEKASLAPAQEEKKVI